MKTSLKFVAAVLLILVVAAASLLALPGNVTAMQRLLGFLPSAGLVDQSVPMRVLAEPVSHTREGITVTVSAAILSADKTLISFNVENVPWSARSNDERVAGCTGIPSLRLPDGKLFESVTGQGVYDFYSFTYPSIPADINEAVFVMACVSQTLPGKAPENWELPLRFIPAPPGAAAPVRRILDMPLKFFPYPLLIGLSILGILMPIRWRKKRS